MRFFWFSCGFNLFKSSSHIKKFTKIFTFSYILFASVICISLSVIIIIIIITFMFVRFRIKHTTIDIFLLSFFSHIFNKFRVQQFNMLYAYHIPPYRNLIKRLLHFLSFSASTQHYLSIISLG